MWKSHLSFFCPDTRDRQRVDVLRVHQVSSEEPHSNMGGAVRWDLCMFEPVHDPTNCWEGATNSQIQFIVMSSWATVYYEMQRGVKIGVQSLSSSYNVLEDSTPIIRVHITMASTVQGIVLHIIPSRCIWNQVFGQDIFVQWHRMVWVYLVCICHKLPPLLVPCFHSVIERITES